MREYFGENNPKVTSEEFLAARRAAEIIEHEKIEKEKAGERDRIAKEKERKKVEEYFKEKGGVHIITKKDALEAEKFIGQEFDERNN